MKWNFALRRTILPENSGELFQSVSEMTIGAWAARDRQIKNVFLNYPESETTNVKSEPRRWKMTEFCIFRGVAHFSTPKESQASSQFLQKSFSGSPEIREKSSGVLIWRCSNGFLKWKVTAARAMTARSRMSRLARPRLPMSQCKCKKDARSRRRLAWAIWLIGIRDS